MAQQRQRHRHHVLFVHWRRSSAIVCVYVCFFVPRFSIIIHFKLCLRHSKILLCVFGRIDRPKIESIACNTLAAVTTLWQKVWLALCKQNEPNPFLVQSMCASFCLLISALMTAGRCRRCRRRRRSHCHKIIAAPSTHKRIIKFMNWMSVGGTRSQLGPCVHLTQADFYLQ